MAAASEPDPKELLRWAGRALRPYLGWILVAAGALLVLLGYLGVSRESIIEKQVPYLVSGGIGGVLLCILGAYVLGTEELRKDSGRLDRLERMVDELHGTLLQRTDQPADVDVPAVAGGRRVRRTLVTVEGGATFHVADCPLAEGKSAEKVTAAAAVKRGLRPCPLCEPDAA